MCASPGLARGLRSRSGRALVALCCRRLNVYAAACYHPDPADQSPSHANKGVCSAGIDSYESDQRPWVHWYRKAGHCGLPCQLVQLVVRYA